MSKTNNFVFTALLVVAWVIFVGLCIQAGGLLVNFFFSIFRPESIPYLYEKLDLNVVYQENRFIFYAAYSFMLVIAVLKAFLFYIVVAMMHKMNLAKPFDHFVAQKISHISRLTLSIGLLSYIAAEWSVKQLHYAVVANNLGRFWEDWQAFVLMGAVLYIIATIFKKGVELQHENELTV